MTPQANDAGRGLRDQISRYSGSFVAVVTMVVLAALVGGYILSQERLSLPSWFPVLGHEKFALKAEFQAGDALTPGQGQAVTIAGAKVGEIGAVELKHGVALVTMEITPKYAHWIYKDATLIMRPKTQLKDETIQVTPGSPQAGKVSSGETFSLAQTTNDASFEQFLAAFDAETRTYLQELLAGAGIALKGNGRALSADFRRFDPLTRDIQKITSELHLRHRNIERAIHNFHLLLSTLGSKDTQLGEAIDSANRVFTVFARQQTAVEETLRQLPGTLKKTDRGLGALGKALDVVAPTLTKLHPTAVSLAPAQRAERALFKSTASVVEQQIRPFAREALPVFKQLTPATKSFDKALPGLSSSFGVLNELFNELAYNPGPNQAGFLFFLDWQNHNFNSAFSNADANGALGRTLLYFNCKLPEILQGLTEINPNARVLLGLLKPPTSQECEANHIPTLTSSGAGIASAHTASAHSAATASSVHMGHAAGAHGGGR
jgi:phospholipid/cholesterol/gamma-HCH transport system substrate-binding protein